MHKRTFIIIAIAGGIVIVLSLIFFVFSNLYTRVNPPAPAATAESKPVAPSASEDPKAELITIWEGPTLGATTGIDGVRLVFLDKPRAIIKVVEFDGTGEQKLSDVFAGVQKFAVSPAKDEAWLQLNDPVSANLITLLYNFRTRQTIRLEEGIKALDFSPDGNKVVYYVAPKGSVPQIKIVDLLGKNAQLVKDNFLLQEPVLKWYAPDRIAFWLVPKSERPSALISTNLSGEETIELFPTNLALQAKFSADGKYALVSFNDATTQKPLLVKLDTGDKAVTQVPLKTWVDKCTWADDSSLAVCFEPQDLPGGFVYPDSDDGSLAYRDRLWSIEAATGKPARIYDVPEEFNDVLGPILSGDLKRLTFLDRTTNKLLSLDLSDKLFPVTAPKDKSAEKTNSAASSAGL